MTVGTSSPSPPSPSLSSPPDDQPIFAPLSPSPSSTTPTSYTNTLTSTPVLPKVQFFLSPVSPQPYYFPPQCYPLPYAPRYPSPLGLCTTLNHSTGTFFRVNANGYPCLMRQWMSEEETGEDVDGSSEEEEEDEEHGGCGECGECEGIGESDESEDYEEEVEGRMEDSKGLLSRRGITVPPPPGLDLGRKMVVGRGWVTEDAPITVESGPMKIVGWREWSADGDDDREMEEGQVKEEQERYMRDEDAKDEDEDGRKRKREDHGEMGGKGVASQDVMRIARAAFREVQLRDEKTVENKRAENDDAQLLDVLPLLGKVEEHRVEKKRDAMTLDNLRKVKEKDGQLGSNGDDKVEEDYDEEEDVREEKKCIKIKHTVCKLKPWLEEMETEMGKKKDVCVLF